MQAPSAPTPQANHSSAFQPLTRERLRLAVSGMRESFFQEAKTSGYTGTHGEGERAQRPGLAHNLSKPEVA